MNKSEQNSTINLERMSAYDKCDRRVELLSIARFVICVVLVVVLAVVRIWMYVSVFYCNVFLFYCFLASFLWMLSDRCIYKEKKKAARFYQLFECDILGTRWNTFLCGPKPLPEDVYLNMSSDLSKSKERFVGQVVSDSKEAFALNWFRMDVAYFSNAMGMHKKWCNWIFVLFMIIVAAASCLVFASNINAIVLYALAPWVPILIWFSSYRNKYRKGKEQLEVVEMLINDSIEAGYTSDKNNIIQDYLFMYNKDAYAVPEFLFQRRTESEKGGVES